MTVFTPPTRSAGVDQLSPPELLRYSRHLLIPEVGRRGQERLKAARVLLVGTGGLGSPLAMYLAAAGVGTLGLVDFDVVDTTNLQRQILHGTSDIGRHKLESSCDRLREINPHVSLELHNTRLTSENALGILADYDIVADGTDNFPTRYLVNDACALLGKPNVYGSIFRFEGQVSVFWAERGPCYRCIFPEPPPPGLVPSCADAGVIGVLPGIIGSLQALEVIKLIVGVGEPLIGRMHLFDAAMARWRELKLRRRPDCPLCGEHPTLHGLIDYVEFCGGSAETRVEETVPSLSATEFHARYHAGESWTLVDVRETHEWEIVNLEEYGARLIPLGQLGGRLEELMDAGPIALLCRSGVRSAKAARQLRDAGFAEVFNLEGGILAWSEEVDPSKPRY